MKCRVINLEPYEFEAKELLQDGSVKIHKVPFDVKDWLTNGVLFAETNLMAMDRIHREDLAREIEKANGSILVSEEQYKWLTTGLDLLSAKVVKRFPEDPGTPAMNRNHTEFIRRILEAPEETIEKKAE